MQLNDTDGKGAEEDDSVRSAVLDLGTGMQREPGEDGGNKMVLTMRSIASRRSF